MARASRPRKTGENRPAGGDRAASPFEVLAKLRGGQRATSLGAPSRPGGGEPQPAPQPRPEQADQPAAAAGLAAEDVALFHAAVDDATPLPSDGRVELQPPKPAPVPRPRPAEVEESPPASPRRAAPSVDDDEALFLAAMEDVIPLKDQGRLDIGPAPRRERPPGSSPASGHRLPSPLPPMLPAAEPADATELFRHAVRGAQPLDTRNRVELSKPLPPPAPLKRAADEDAALRESLEAPLNFEDRLDMGDETAFLRPGLPRRVLTDLRRGRWVLQGELDLHGLTREEAREALARFLASSLQQGRRCVRVIHGKGLGSPGRFGILKHLSRGWLAQREEILAFCQAGPHAGGSGALLVLLRAGTAGQNPPVAPDGRP